MTGVDLRYYPLGVVPSGGPPATLVEQESLKRDESFRLANGAAPDPLSFEHVHFSLDSTPPPPYYEFEHVQIN
jgi:hypothetical protein